MPGSPPSEVGVTQPTSGNPEAPLTGLPAPRGEMVVVGIGASAGGLDACQKLLEALPPRTGMAWILVQHLDPTHESMMAELLAAHTSMTVCEAAEGMLLEPEHLYVIVPDAYLSVAQGVLRLTRPQARHGARLPFDYLLHSLAQEYGDRAACVILSGTGADGSLGLMSVKARGGLVIAQDPDEAAYGGMPRSAIQTNAVDLVLPVERIPASLLPHRDRSCAQSATTDVPAKAPQATANPRGSPRSSSSCGRERRTTSRCTSTARCGAVSSGAARWPGSTPATWTAISPCSAMTPANSICWRRTC